MHNRYPELSLTTCKVSVIPWLTNHRKLLDQVRDKLRLKNYSYATECIFFG